MTCRACGFGEIIFLAVALTLTGCGPSGLSQSDELKEPHFLAGKSRVIAMDYDGAIECFEKALEVNPQSASAHFEMGWLYDQKLSDPAAAIYHYSHYLKLCRNAVNADLVNQHILTCKQELARTVSLGPITEKVQQEFEHLSDENKRLTLENKTLHDELDKWTAYAHSLQALTNRGSGMPPSNRLSQPNEQVTASSSNLAIANHPASSPAPGSRNHTVKPGETPTLIARKYGIKLDVLMAANPGLNARRLKVGQALSIPGP